MTPLVPKSPKKPWTAGSIMVAGLSGGLVMSSIGLALPFVAPAIRRVCLPYIPATPLAIENVMTALKSGKPPSATVRPTVVDIGSGDGRIVSLKLMNILIVSIIMFRTFSYISFICLFTLC